MGQVIGEFLPLALGVAISPIPIIAVILMLFSGRAKQNSLAFLVGWIVGIVAAMSILIGVASTQDLASGGEPSDASSWIKLALGFLLVVAAAGQWRKRPKPGEEPTMPGWMTKIDSMKPGAALGLGVLLSAVNPKNFLLIAAAAVTISQADLSSTDTAIVVGVFTLIGASTVAVPTLGYLFLGAKIQPKLDVAKAWLSANNTTVMAVLLLVIGVTLFGKGLGALL
jgi:threonine/homoserine/homoserine lactone efflux protein